MKVRGTITLFLALVFVAVIAVIGGLFESARFQVAKEKVLDDGYLAMQNVLAEYQRELWEDYHVFFVDGGTLGGDEEVRKKVDSYLKEMVQPEEKNFLNAEAEFTNARLHESMVAGKGKYFRKQAVAYMKYAAAEELLKNSSKAIGKGEAFLKTRATFKKVAKAKIKAEKRLLKLESLNEKRKESFSKVNEGWKELKKIGKEGGDVVKIREKAKTLKEEIQKAKKKVKKIDQKYEKEKVLGKKEMEAFTEELEKQKEDLLKEDYDNLKQNTDAFFSENENGKQSIEEKEKKLNKILSLSEKDDEVSVEQLKKELDFPEMEEESTKKKSAKKELKKYQRELDEEEKGGKSGNFWIDLLSGGELSLSAKKIRKTNWKEFEEEKESVPIGERGMLFLYMKKHFPHFLTEKTKEGEKKEEALDYGLEYIAMGKNEDEKNLQAMVQKLFSLRVTVWFSYFLSRADKMAEATKIATAAVGILGPGAVVAVKTAILLGWSGSEARKDMKILLKGKKVPLHPSTPSIETGYENYLDLFLIAAMEKWSERSVRLIEQNMKLRYSKTFRADDCFSGIVGEIKGKVEPRFLRFPFIQSFIGKSAETEGFYLSVSESFSR